MPGVGGPLAREAVTRIEVACVTAGRGRAGRCYVATGTVYGEPSALSTRPDDDLFTERAMLIELHEARVDEKPVLRHLMELYQYDLSETEQSDVGPDGRFGYAYLDDYWFDAGRHPYLIRVDGQLAGLVLVRRLGEEQGEPLHQVAEFFIMRKYRRRGAGRSIARRVLDAFPGIWTVQQREENALAQAFWRKVIAEYTGGRYEETRVRTAEWRGPVQRFRSRRAR